MLRSRGRHTVYIYNVGPDALQHMRGNVAQYLTHLDRSLTELNRRYREQTGRDLEIVLLSDHGHNRASDATFLPIADVLRAHGFRLARTLTSPLMWRSVWMVSRPVSVCSVCRIRKLV